MTGVLRVVPGVAWGILLAALLVRGSIALLAGNELGGDALEYDRYARSIAAGDGYPPSNIAESGPTAFFPPLFPALLGVVYWLTGDGVTAAKLVECLLGTGVVALVGIVSQQVWGRRVALVAMVAAAVYPPFLLLVTTLLSESLFLVFELAALAAVLQHRTSDRPYLWVIAAGLLVGLATLTRANGIILVLPLAVGVLTARPPVPRRSLVQALVLVLATLMVIAPWSVRNSLTFDRFLPLTTQADLAVARNYNASAERSSGTPQTTESLLELTRSGDNEAEIASRGGEMGREYVLDHPGYAFETVLRNTARALGFADGPRLTRAFASNVGADTTLARAGTYSFYLFAALALVGALVPAARRAPWWVWAVPVMLWLSVFWLAAGRVRYRLPIDPFIIMLASIAIVEGLRRFGSGAHDGQGG